MPSANPIVSIVMSVYNDSKCVGMAIESILAQTYDNFEFIIIDDGSSDSSASIISKYAACDARIKFFKRNNSGLGPSLHFGIRNAKGSLIARMDADDVSAPTRLQRLVNFLRDNPEHVLVGCWALYYHEVLGIINTHTPSNNDLALKAKILKGESILVHGSVMFRKDIYLQVSGYRLPYRSQDLDLWLQLLNHGKFGVLESFEYLFQVNYAGTAFKRKRSDFPLRKLVLQLYQERQVHGFERTSFLEECKRIQRENEDILGPDIDLLKMYSNGAISQFIGNTNDAIKYFRKCIGLSRLGFKAFTKTLLLLFLGAHRNAKLQQVDELLKSKEFIWVHTYLAKSLHATGPSN